MNLVYSHLGSIGLARHKEMKDREAIASLYRDNEAMTDISSRHCPHTYIHVEKTTERTKTDKRESTLI